VTTSDMIQELSCWQIHTPTSRHYWKHYLATLLLCGW